jgi:nicotinate-nucleotide pyrophosphorylase (carboxylating)
MVSHALHEDIGKGDITARLIEPAKNARAKVITREQAVICGVDWVNEVFAEIDPAIKVIWYVKDGDEVKPDTVLFEVAGNARSLLTAERSALNFLQTLSGTATLTRAYVNKISHTQTKLLDTRKTLPGWRLAQKYAVRCGGGKNHRMGLYDAFLIKENHIISSGSITHAVDRARKLAPELPIEVEVENLTQLQEAIDNQVDIVMLDNFTLDMMKQAVVLNKNRVKLEVSGNVTLATIASVAELGVDYISVGSLTKHIHAIDLSMRIDMVKDHEPHSRHC